MRLFTRNIMEEKIKVSAIINTKNNEEKLCETLESIKDFDEIIVIDEHSTDDTIEIAKEYKAKIIYADKNNLALAQNQALNESKNDWIFIVKQNEIIPQKLIFEISNYILNPKKNKLCCSFFQKKYYLNKEIKSALSKNNLRLFKKDYAEFKNDYSFDLKIKQGKIHKIKPNSKAKNAYILKFIEPNIVKNISEILDNARNLYKEADKITASIILKPALVFLNWYFIKKGFLDGRRGFILAKQKYIESFILQTMILEGNNKNDL